MRLGTQMSVIKSHTEYIYSIFAAEGDEQSISMIAADSIRSLQGENF